MLRKLSLGVVAALFSLAAPLLAMAGPKVVFETNLGSFTVEVDEDNAPVTAANFLAYVDAGQYDNVVFHRVIPKFMAQTGGFGLTDRGYVEKKTNAPIKNEADNGLKNMRGTLAMARTGDPHSASAQFFINFVDNKFLNHSAKTQRGWGYAVFGKVVSGMETVDKMAEIPTTQKVVTARDGFGGLRKARFSDVPSRDIVIKSAKRAE